MYGERFYGDEVLFGLSEIIYFAGAVIKGDGVALAAPVLVNVTQAHSRGETLTDVLPLLASQVMIAIVGDADLLAEGVLVTPTTAVLDGESGLSAPRGVLIYPTTGAALGGSALPPPMGLLRFAPNAQALGETTVNVVPVLWLYPTASLSGDAVVVTVPTTWHPTGAIIDGTTSVNGAGVLRSITTADIQGDATIAAAGNLLLPTSGALAGDAIINAPLGIVRFTSSSTLTGDTALLVRPVLREARLALMVGEGVTPQPSAMLRSIRTGVLFGIATLGGGVVTTDVRTAVLLGASDALSTLTTTHFATAALTGESVLKAPAWLLWNEDMTQILASGGAVIYSTDGEGVVIAKFVDVPNLRGSTLVEADTIGRVITGASFFTVLDPSRTGADAGGFANVGVVVTR